jgi:hypothetical protein
MRISISMCLRQHLLHIQSSSLKLRHIFKFNTQRSTITGSECETFEGTEYRSQSAWQITVRMSNHSVTVTLSNTHIWIRRFSHTLASLQQARFKITHCISNFHPNPLISMNRTYTLLSASRSESRTKLDDATQGFTNLKFTEDEA